MSFIELGALLGYYERLFGAHTRAKEVIRDAIFTETGITLPLEKITIKNNTASIESGSVFKNTLFFKREKILERVRSVEIYDLR